MKDDKLEKQFEEYFKGVNTPDNITGDAKKFAVRKKTVLPKIAKYASIAASFVIVVAAAIIGITRSGFFAPNSKPGENNPSDNAPGTDAPGANEPGADAPSSVYTTYTTDGLKQAAVNSYSASRVDGSFKFIERFAFADNAAVDGLTAYYTDDELTLVTGDVSFMSGLNRYDAKVHVEYTEQNTVLKDLESYYDGRAGSYRGHEYFITKTTAENGEPQFKLIINYNSVKYYFDITSSDEDAYKKYFEIIFK